MRMNALPSLSTALELGLKSGEVIVRLNGRTLDLAAISALKTHERTTVDVRRGGQTFSLSGYLD